MSPRRTPARRPKSLISRNMIRSPASTWRSRKPRSSNGAAPVRRQQGPAWRGAPARLALLDLWMLSAQAAGAFFRLAPVCLEELVAGSVTDIGSGVEVRAATNTGLPSRDQRGRWPDLSFDRPWAA